MTHRRQSADVSVFPGIGERPPDAILECARRAELVEVTIIGRTAEGGLYFATSLSLNHEINWELDVAKKRLFEFPVTEDTGDNAG